MFKLAQYEHFRDWEKIHDGVIRGIVNQDQLPFMRRFNQRGSLGIFAKSPRAVLEMVNETYPYPNGKRNSSADRSRSGSDSFHSFRTYEEAWDTFYNNPHKVTNLVVNEKDIEQRQSAGIEVGHDVTGDYLDLDRYLQGEPEQFASVQWGRPQRIIATIMFNMSTWAGVRADTMQARANRIVRLVDWLENNNVRTEIMAFNSTNVLHFECDIKHAEETLDINALAVASHPDFFRRILFRLMEYSDTWTWGYGGVGRTDDMHKVELMETGLSIMCEQHNTSEAVNNAFDRAEQEIEEFLGDLVTNHIAINI